MIVWVILRHKPRFKGVYCTSIWLHTNNVGKVMQRHSKEKRILYVYMWMFHVVCGMVSCCLYGYIGNVSRWLVELVYTCIMSLCI